MVWFQSPYSFGCVATLMPSGDGFQLQRRTVVLNFTPNLTLRSHVYQTGLQALNFIFSASKDKLVFSSSTPQSGYRFHLYALDCRTRDIQFAHESYFLHHSPTYGVDEEGVPTAVGIDDGAIVIVKLN